MISFEPVQVSSHAKLLITGEYAVMKGAKALAVPLKYKQHLLVKPDSGHLIRWKSYLPDKSLWMEAAYDRDTLRQVEGDKTSQSQLIRNILSVLKELQPNLFKRGYNMETRLEFSPQWGWGTSSSLIANLSKWAQINPFELLDRTFNGSGYDVTVALGGKQLLFWREGLKRHWQFVHWKPRFRRHLYFVHLNRKQDTVKTLKKYNRLDPPAETLELITNLTERMLHTDSLDEFMALMTEHEAVTGQMIGQKPVKQKLFADFDGAIKSLGAWGGDMIMAAGGKDTPEYFKEKGYQVVFGFDELINQK